MHTIKGVIISHCVHRNFVKRVNEETQMQNLKGHGLLLVDWSPVNEKQAVVFLSSLELSRATYAAIGDSTPIQQFL